MTRIHRSAGAAALLLLAGAFGCKEATLDPSAYGDIEGRVLDYETGAAIAGASITTTPASEALVTDAQGNFTIQDLETGTYQVAARKAGYTANTVSVAVRAEQSAEASIYLQAEDSTETTAALDVTVTSFWNAHSEEGDSTFVEAEYRVENTGAVPVNAYEVYFRIPTTGDTYYHSEAGDTLKVGQSDIGRFKTYIQSSQATAVQVDTVWSDPPLHPSS